MKEKLKILAKWFYGEDIKIWSFGDTFIEVDVNRSRITFQPLTYPAQMGRLIEKMILEIYEKTGGEISLTTSFDGRRYICRITSDAVRVCKNGDGTSIERAEFNILLNYINPFCMHDIPLDSWCKKCMYKDFEKIMEEYRSGKPDSIIFEWALKYAKK